MELRKRRRMPGNTGRCATRCGPEISGSRSIFGTASAEPERSRRWTRFSFRGNEHFAMTSGGASPVLQIVHHLSMRNPTPPGPMQLPATWNASAPGYAEYMVTHAVMYAERALEIVSLRPTDNVLDVAAGPGSLAFVAAPRAAHVLAIDFADGMVEQIRTRAKRDGVSNVQARVMDAQSLDLPEGSFDAAFCMFGFMFFPDRMQAFRELCRVLRPGGRALVATWAPIERRPLMKVGFDSLAEALPGLPA